MQPTVSRVYPISREKEVTPAPKESYFFLTKDLLWQICCLSFNDLGPATNGTTIFPDKIHEMFLARYFGQQKQLAVNSRRPYTVTPLL